MTREYDLLEIEDGKVKSINKCSMPEFLDLCNLPNNDRVRRHKHERYI